MRSFRSLPPSAPAGSKASAPATLTCAPKSSRCCPTTARPGTRSLRLSPAPLTTRLSPRPNCTPGRRSCTTRSPPGSVKAGWASCGGRRIGPWAAMLPSRCCPPTSRATRPGCARFEREAKLLAALNHDNIAAIYSVHESRGVRFLAMEYVDGEDLATRIARGALPFEQTLAIARQIAEALEEAHEKGIVHRDLKPANVKLKSDGKVKVLDFGLAKALDTTDAPQSLPIGDAGRFGHGNRRLHAARASARTARWTRGPTTGPSAWCCSRCSAAGAVCRRDADRRPRCGRHGGTRLAPCCLRRTPPSLRPPGEAMPARKTCVSGCATSATPASRSTR